MKDYATADAIRAETTTAPELFLMAAAVSDYSPVPAQGKIRSTEQTMSIAMERNPKLLDTLRERCPDSYLVGFKLLSGVSQDQLIDVARRQLERAGLDLTVANDLQHFAPGRHPIVLVDRDTHHEHQGSKGCNGSHDLVVRGNSDRFVFVHGICIPLPKGSCRSSRATGPRT